MQATNDDVPGAIESAATSASETFQLCDSANDLLRLAGRKADLVAVRLHDGDVAGAMDYLRAAADYIETAMALQTGTGLAVAA